VIFNSNAQSFDSWVPPEPAGEHLASWIYGIGPQRGKGRAGEERKGRETMEGKGRDTQFL